MAQHPAERRKFALTGSSGLTERDESKRSWTTVLKCRVPECGHEGEPKIKMGGLICAKCRIILKWPHEPEYREMFKKQKEKSDERDTASGG
jgi:hypothetical protein